MPENHGPKIENLRKVMQMFPAMARKLEDQKLGKPTASRKPTKICAVCCVAFDFEVTATKGLEEGICDKCWGQLQDGCGAFIHGETFAILKLPEGNEMIGKIVEVTEVEMIQIAKQFKIQQRVKNGPAKTSEDGVPPVA